MLSRPVTLSQCVAAIPFLKKYEVWYRGRSLLLFFFFSSRRRHTRFDCDWSSDVCSSDLGKLRERDLLLLLDHSARRVDGHVLAVSMHAHLDFIQRLAVFDLARVPADGRRSEEHTSELQSQSNLVCRLLLEKKTNKHHVAA